MSGVHALKALDTIVLAAVRGGAGTMADISSHAAAAGMCSQWRVLELALMRLRRHGYVAYDGGRWRAAAVGANDG